MPAKEMPVLFGPRPVLSGPSPIDSEAAPGDHVRSELHSPNGPGVTAVLSLLGYTFFVVGLFVGDAFPARVLGVLLPCLAKVLTIVGRAGLTAPLNALLTDGAGHEASRQRVGGLVGTFGLGYATGSALGGYLSNKGMVFSTECCQVLNWSIIGHFIFSTFRPL